MFLLPALGAWITDGLVLYIFFSNKGTVDPNNNSTHITPGGINDNFTTADVLCGGRDDLSHCQKQKGFALDNALKNGQSLHVVSDTIDNKDIIQPEDLEQIFAGENAAVPTNEDKDSKSHDNQKIGISASSVESNTGYLAVLAIIRLLLLTFPLSY